MLKSHLGPMLKARRMSIREFARRIDYRFDSVRLLVNNDIQRIPADLIERTCRELNITPGELFSIEDDEADESDKEEFDYVYGKI